MAGTSETSFQLSAVSPQYRFQAANEPGEHPLHFHHLRCQRLVRRTRQQAQIPGKKKMILKFAPGSQRDAAEPAKLAIAAPSASLGDVRRHRDRSPDHLVAKAELSASEKVGRNHVHVD